jgi:hypothetical protein
MSNAPLELDASELKKEEIAEKLASVEKKPNIVMKWVATQVADLFYKYEESYIPEFLEEYLPVFRVVERENLGKINNSQGTEWFIGSEKQISYEKYMEDHPGRDLVLIKSTIGDLQKAGEVKIHNNGKMLWVKNLSGKEPYNIVKENIPSK